MTVTSAAVTKVADTRKSATSAVVTQLGIIGGGATPSEVQLLGSLIGSGLSDTGIGDATNLLVSTQGAFSGPDWIKYLSATQSAPGSTMADVNALAPDSTNTASTLTETALTQTHECIQRFTTAASALVCNFQIYAKVGLRTRIHLVIRDTVVPATNFATVTLDISGLQVGVAASIGGNFTSPSATIASASNGFALCTLTCTTGGSGTYTAEIYPDASAGTAASNASYAGNTTAPALTVWGARVTTGTLSGNYITNSSFNANGGAAASTVQQAFVPNGGTTAYWGTRTSNAWVGFDAGVPVQFTRYRFAPRPSSVDGLPFPYTPDYAPTAIVGAQVQTSVSDSTFAAPTTVDTIPAFPYYPRYWLNERPLAPSASSRYVRFLPPPTAFGGLSELQVFALAGTTANASPVQPVISPMGGRFPILSALVTITSLTQGAVIYYTMDGSTPTTSSTKYTGPFTLAMQGNQQITIKAIANLASLSTPTSLVTTSAPFCGFGFHPKADQFDDKGHLIEAHAARPMWDPNTSAYYWVGRFMDINTILFGAQATLNGFPAAMMYKSVDLLNWTFVGDIAAPPPTALRGGGYKLLYNALNNNYVLWTNVIVDTANDSSGWVATAPKVTGPWTWAGSAAVANTFFDFDPLIDSDGVTAYMLWRQDATHTIIKQMTADYTGVTGTALTITSTTTREGFAWFKYPNAPGGTYFLCHGTTIPFDSTLEGDFRYNTNTGATPLVASWSASGNLSNGTGCYVTDPIGTVYNGQFFGVFVPQGQTQPVICANYWTISSLYGSRQAWQPVNITGPTTMLVARLSDWEPARLPVFASVFFGTATGNKATLAAAALQFERTQPWTMFCEIQVAATPGVGNASILFTNVLGASPFSGYEVWIDPNGFLRFRMINTYSTNYCGVIGSVNVCTGVPVLVAVTYDGSSTAAGVKMYVNGVQDTGTSIEANTLSATIIASGQIWEIGNQLNFNYGLQGYMGFMSIDAIVRSASYIGLYSLKVLPPMDPSNTKLFLTFEDQNGTTVTDFSPSAFNATLSSANLWAGVLPSKSQIAFDAIASNTASGVTSLAATLTTAGPGELIYVTAITTTGVTPGISDTASLTWTLRAAVAPTGAFLYSWYAIAPNKLTADVITITLGTANLFQINAIAFTGPSERPLAIPAGSSTTTALMAQPTAPSGLVLAFYSSAITTPTPGAGWTSIYDTDFSLLEYKTNTTMIGSETALATNTTGGIIEAIN